MSTKQTLDHSCQVQLGIGTIWTDLDADGMQQIDSMYRCEGECIDEPLDAFVCHHVAIIAI